MNFKWKGTHYRLSLDREVGKVIDSKSAAEGEAERIRTEIRNGTFRSAPSAAEPASLTSSAFAEIWKEQRGGQLFGAKDNSYRLAKICALPLASKLTFGETPLAALTTNDIEAVRESRRAAGLSAVTINYDLKLLRKMLNWAVRKGYLDRTPFKIGTEPAISLDREIPRNWRFEDEGDEQKLLDAANPHLRGVITALLDTACRPGEILSLQWRDVNLARKEITIRAEKAKTRMGRIVPISTRLLATLEMRKLDAGGAEFPPDAYVFGDEIGQRVKSVRTAWENACQRAGLKGLQLRDLRHEAGSRFDEAGVAISYTSKLLGHSNLNTTSRYLNSHRRGLHAAMQKLEEHRASVAQALHTAVEDAQASVPSTAEAHSDNLPVC